MFVCDRMSTPAVTIRSKTSFESALDVMRNHRFRRLPVVNAHGKLVGIISECDLLHAAPSSATSLSVWEVHYLLNKLDVKELMTEDVITTTADTPIEDAARLMVTHKIGGLPVVDKKGGVVGVITETDIFKTFAEMLDGGQSGLRLTLAVPKRKGVLAMLATTIYELGGGIESVGSFQGGKPGQRQLVVKVRDVRKKQLVKTLEDLGDQVLDARDV